MNRAPGRFRFSFAALACLAGVLVLVTARTAQPMCPLPPAPPAVWYVATGGTGVLDGMSWAHAFPNLDSALTSAVDGDEIWVAQGTWGPSNPSTGFVITKRLKIYGAFRGFETSVATRTGSAALTILTAQKPGLYPPAPHVIAISNVTIPMLGGGPGVLLDSVLIRDGAATGTGTNVKGAGIYSVNSDVDLTDCIVKENIADSDGGGLYFEGTGVSFSANTLHIVGCEFFGNRTVMGEGGAIYGSWVKATF